MLFLVDKQNVLVPSQNRVETAGLAPQGSVCASTPLCHAWDPGRGRGCSNPELCVPISACSAAAVSVGQTHPHSSRGCPEPGLGQSFPPPQSQPCTNPTATLSAACALCSRTRTMLQAEKVLELFQRCCGKSCTPMASMCELHPTLVPISLQRSHLTACAAPPCAAAPPWPGKYTPQF